MSRAHSSFIPAEQIDDASTWAFDPVDQAALRFAAKVKAQAEAEDRLRASAAHESGYAEGFAQGHAQATLEGQRLLGDYMATQGQDTAEQFLGLFHSAQEQLEQSQQTLAQGVLELACELARQVLRRELSVQPQALQPVVHEALGMLTADTKVAAVRLHPQDIEALAEPMARDFPNLQLTLVPDANLTPGGCVVEAAGTVVDATVQRRWHKTVASLGLASQWEQDLDVR